MIQNHIMSGQIMSFDRSRDTMMPAQPQMVSRLRIPAMAFM